MLYFIAGVWTGIVLTMFATYVGLTRLTRTHLQEFSEDIFSPIRRGRGAEVEEVGRSEKLGGAVVSSETFPDEGEIEEKFREDSWGDEESEEQAEI